MRIQRGALLIGCLGLLAFWGVSAGGVEPRLKWSFETQGKIYASPILADLDNDGKPEVIVCASRDKRVICLNGEGERRWDYRIEDTSSDGIQAPPSAVDYDGDGHKEVFFATEGGVVGCLDFQGSLIWRVFLADKVDYSGPVVADVDQDRRIEVVVGSESGTVYCLDDCGIEKWRYQGEGPVRGVPAVAWDPETKVIGVFATFGGGAEVCLNGQGKPLWTHTEPSPKRERRSSPAIGVIDPDFRLDVVTATEDFQVIVRDAFTGQEHWRWAGKSSCDQTNSFALADSDRRNRMDVFCADGTGQGGAGHVYRLRDGQALWSADVGGGVVQGPSIADVDGDGRPEILVCSRSKRLICLAEDGKEKWSYPSKTEVLTTPAIGDIDGDGKAEIVFTSKDRFVYCLTVDGAYNAELAPWPMAAHDPQLTSNFYGAPFTPPALGSPAPLPDLYLGEIKNVHIGDNVIEGQVTNNWFRPRHLEASVAIWLPDGTCINRTITRRFESLAIAPFKFEFPALYDGKYVLRTSLLDVGQGRMVAPETDKTFDLDKEADLDHDVTLALLAKEPIFTDMVEGPARTRLEATAAQVEQTWKTALDQLKATVTRPEATLKERRDALKTSQQAARELKRVFGRVHAVRATPGKALDFAVVPETTLRKIFKDEPLLPPYIAGKPNSEPPLIALAGNEVEGCQLAVVPVLKDLKNLRVSLASDLAQTGGSGTIPRQDVGLYRVGYVQIGPPEYNFFVERQGEYPDVLFPATPFDVPADQEAQPYFVLVKAQEQTPPGDYAGTVRIEADDCNAIEIPIKVHVWNFHIPAQPQFKVSMWMNENWLKAFYKYPDRTPQDVRQRFLQFHLDHRISPLQLFPTDAGDPMADFEYAMAHGQNCFFVPVPGFLNEAERPAQAEKLLATRAAIQQKGWDRDVMFYSMDEVAVMQRPLIPQMVEMNKWVKTVIPDWPRLETSAPEEALFGAVDLWCPTVDNFDPDVLRDRMAQGDRLWFYTVWGRPGLMIEFPAIDHRILFWECFKYGAEGFLYWGTTHWDLNCQGDQRWPEKPWITYNRQPGHNGCGYLIYPGPNGTPLSSIRLETVRDGIEDYEYLSLLKSLWQAAGEKAAPDLRERARAELFVPAEVVIDHKKFTDNPEYLIKARTRIAELIEAYRAIPAQ